MIASAQQLAAFYDAVNLEASRRSLIGHIRACWHILEPRTRALVETRALHAICEHLEAVTRGEITRLLINVPPGMTKSMSTRVFWPTWEWGPMQIPSTRTVGASYHGALATRDNRRSHIVLNSPMFRRLYPHVQIADDERGKTRFANTAHGFMLATSVDGLGTGERGDRFVIDDPHNVRQGESKAKMQSTGNWFHEVVPTRLNDDHSAIVIIMQRVAVGDVADLAIDLGYEHLCLPMRYEEDRHCTTIIGFSDWRQEEGDLLAPDLFPEERVSEIERALGSYAAAAQLQQRPAPRGGNLIKVDEMERLDVKPNENRIKARIRYFDKAGSDADDADYSAAARVSLVEGVGGEPDFYLVEHVWRDHLTAGPREKRILNTAKTDPRGTRFIVEQEPGSGGKESAEATVRNLRGFSVRVDRKAIDKEQHADPFATAVENGMVKYLPGEWNSDWIDELRNFPAGAHDDQVDATAGAYNGLHAKGRAGVLF